MAAAAGLEGHVGEHRKVDPVRVGEAAGAGGAVAPGDLQGRLRGPAAGVEGAGAGDRLPARKEQAVVAYRHHLGVAGTPVRQGVGDLIVDRLGRDEVACELELAASRREGDVAGVPALRDDRSEQAPLLGREPGIEHEHSAAPPNRTPRRPEPSASGLRRAMRAREAPATPPPRSQSAIFALRIRECLPPERQRPCPLPLCRERPKTTVFSESSPSGDGGEGSDTSEPPAGRVAIGRQRKLIPR